MLIVDYSWSHPTPDAIKAAGYVGAMRYLTSKVDAKLLQAGERDALHAAGLAIGLIWQTTADEARTGHAGGVERARKAEDMADALGYPDQAPIFFAVDFDATADLVRPYAEGFAASHRRPTGVYGSFRVVEGLPQIPYAWQCAAWSRGLISDRAHLYQRIGHTSEARRTLGSTDENRLYRPIPLWLPGGAVVLVNPMKGKVTSAYGPRPAPLPSPHKGIDIAGGGATVRAVADGKVKAARSDSWQGDKRVGVLPWVTGNGALIGHAGFSTYSGHLAKVYVKAGDTVQAGQVIGVEGATGNVTGRHLHFEVHPTGTVTTDPWPWMKAKGVTLGVDPYSVAYVREVQELLNLTGAGLVVDGDLGPRTIAAIEAFQRSAGLVADGDPGPITLAALRGDTATPEPPEPPAPPTLKGKPMRLLKSPDSPEVWLTDGMIRRHVGNRAELAEVQAILRSVGIRDDVGEISAATLAAIPLAGAAPVVDTGEIRAAVAAALAGISVDVDEDAIVSGIASRLPTRLALVGALEVGA